MRRLAAIAILLFMLLVGVTAAAAQAIFRSGVDSVSLDVSVRQRGREIGDLTATDFDVRDNGLPQQILDVTRQVLPIDVTFVIDLSGSVDGPLLGAVTRAVEAVGPRLRPADRAAVLTFNTRVREVRPLSEGGLPTPLALGRATGQTSLFDALTVGLIAPPEPGRRRMLLLFTDGQDGASFIDGTSLLDLARRSEMAVFTVALTQGTARRPQKAVHAALFEALGEATGGTVVTLQQDQDLEASFVQAFDDFRTSYVLRYAYDGPARPGWHVLSVRVTRRGDYDVRARQGYFGR